MELGEAASHPTAHTDQEGKFDLQRDILIRMDMFLPSPGVGLGAAPVPDPAVD